jgi:nucleotide-binding universal stress UspA family protein
MKPFLVALDGSPRAELVFQSAVDLAEALGASIYLLRVITTPPEFPPAGHVSRRDTLPSFLATRAHGELRAFAARAMNLKIETIVRDSSQPWRVIIDVADEVGADLIVVGSHGYHGLDYLLGTNAGKVANLATRNVLVVHAPPERSRADSYRHEGWRHNRRRA